MPKQESDSGQSWQYIRSIQDSRPSNVTEGGFSWTCSAFFGGSGAMSQPESVVDSREWPRPPSFKRHKNIPRSVHNLMVVVKLGKRDPLTSFISRKITKGSVRNNKVTLIKPRYLLATCRYADLAKRRAQFVCTSRTDRGYKFAFYFSLFIPFASWPFPSQTSSRRDNLIQALEAVEPLLHVELKEMR